MDKGKKGGKKKTITITKTPLASKLGGKNNYINNKFNGYYVDSNNAGDIYFNEENPDRENFHKWVFTNTDTAGIYNIKNLKTDLNLSSNEIGDLNTVISDIDSSFQKWSILSTSESESYIILNSANNFILSANKNDKIMMNKLEDFQYEDCSNNIIFRIFQYKAKK